MGHRPHAWPRWRPAELLRAADGAQYQAKRSGGDCVRFAAAPVTGVQEPGRGPRGRDRTPRLTGLLDDALAWLDGDGRDAPVEQRVQAVAELAAEALGAANWAVTVADGEDLRALAQTDRRVAPDVRVVRAAESWSLAEYPATREVLRRGGAFHVRTDDPDADAAERALLARIGRTQLLAAAAGGHLVELHGDEATPPMAWAVGPVRLLVREAATSAAPSA